jgi:hypothetical protein
MTDGMLLREFLGEPDLAAYRYACGHVWCCGGGGGGGGVTEELLAFSVEMECSSLCICFSGGGGGHKTLVKYMANGMLLLQFWRPRLSSTWPTACCCCCRFWATQS